MTTEKMRQYLHAQPFEPFEIITADGARYPVAHPEFVAFSPSRRTVHVELAEDRAVDIDLLLVSTLQKATNGHNAKDR